MSSTSLHSRANLAAPPDGMEVIVRGAGYEGYVVIDSIVAGRSAGGVRIATDLDLDEVRALAREMSRKYSLFLLPRGGAKSGLRLSAELDEEARRSALHDFGRRLGPLIQRGIYYPGMDMNCGPDELRWIYRGAGMELGEVTDTSLFTALTVLHALRATARGIESEGRPTRIAVEGFGSVARHLAERLDPREFEIVALSTIQGARMLEGGLNPTELARRKLESGDAFVDALPGQAMGLQEIFACDVDILLPSSRTWVLTPALAERVNARAIVPISNAPYAVGALDVLDARGIVSLPGYLSNVGGVLASSMFDLGISMPRIEAILASQYFEIVAKLSSLAKERSHPVHELCRELADLHAQSRPAAVSHSLLQRLYDRLLAKRIPRSIRAGRAEAGFVRRFDRILDELQRRENAG